MSQPARNESSNNDRHATTNGNVSSDSNGNNAGQDSTSAMNVQSSSQTSNTAQHDHDSESDQNGQHMSASDERTASLLRLVLAIFRGGSAESTAGLVDVIRRSSREGTDEVDLRAVAAHALQTYRNDPGVAEELEAVELLLADFQEEAIYTRLSE